MLSGMLSRLAPALFFLSGAAGLILQVAWFRLLSLSLGGSLAATTAVLSAFMFGLAAGAWWLGRRTRRLRDGVVAYGLLELGAGCAALLTLPALDALGFAGIGGGVFPGFLTLAGAAPPSSLRLIQPTRADAGIFLRQVSNCPASPATTSG